ncbi:helix-turn-helix domain-containing protein [Glycomyces salinus]|uniref:helix-turn-helix domain-containing protein n=1 Tax=Glycomyces salinus TaxID=980294 RepID=UPI0018EBCFA1|nr:helix-turn-helix transcriptional regulator [Glycomyces salinus]
MSSEKFLQREIGRTLIKYREKKGLTKEEAVWFLGTSKKILNSYESGTLQYPEPAVVADWLGQYEAPQAVIDDARAKTKWIRQGNPASWQESAPNGFARFTQIELLAVSLDIHEDTYVTGLLQVPGYAEAVLSTNPNLTSDDRRAAVGFRAQRAEAFFNRQSKAPRLRVVMSEVSLTRFRGADFYEDQIEHLRHRNRQEGVDIFIAPTGKTTPSTGWSYTIMSFDNAKDPDVVYLENLLGAQYEADRKKVDWCRSLFSTTVPMVLGLEDWRASDADK